MWRCASVRMCIALAMSSPFSLWLRIYVLKLHSGKHHWALGDTLACNYPPKNTEEINIYPCNHVINTLIDTCISSYKINDLTPCLYVLYIWKCHTNQKCLSGKADSNLFSLSKNYTRAVYQTGLSFNRIWEETSHECWFLSRQQLTVSHCATRACVLCKQFPHSVFGCPFNYLSAYETILRLQYHSPMLTLRQRLTSEPSGLPCLYDPAPNCADFQPNSDPICAMEPQCVLCGRVQPSPHSSNAVEAILHFRASPRWRGAEPAGELCWAAPLMTFTYRERHDGWAPGRGHATHIHGNGHIGNEHSFFTGTQAQASSRW